MAGCPQLFAVFEGWAAQARQQNFSGLLPSTPRGLQRMQDWGSLGIPSSKSNLVESGNATTLPLVYLVASACITRSVSANASGNQFVRRRSSRRPDHFRSPWHDCLCRSNLPLLPAGWPTFPLNELRLPHPSRFSKDGLQKLGNELFPASYPQLRGALLIH